ncbi:Copper(I)-binding protein [Sinosporangium album]|uniref:Copper(I)-binding protein n=1 Tax=Sinosporangium album TaxID=504805 RepID=A0A1G8IHT2_9ACTN|nr:copper chaperone PCu(A)C [Sinosporangium album]SDI18453.1 Copper(I)-binding protein [Sinosporangium album]
MMITVCIQRLLWCVALVAASGAGGCGSPPWSPGEQPLSPEGALAAKDGLRLQDVSVLGPAPTETVQVGASLPLYFSMTNEGGQPDSLVGVSAPGVARSVAMSRSPVAVPPGRSVWMGGNVKVTLTGLLKPLQVGQVVTVIMHFQRAGEIVVGDVPVQPASYATTLPR